MPASDLDGLQLLYFYSVDAGLIQTLQKEWSKLIYDKALSLVKSTKSTRESVLNVVSKFIELKNLTDSIIEKCFQ